MAADHKHESGITGEHVVNRGSLFRLLADDHVRFAELLKRARSRSGGKLTRGPMENFALGC